MSRKVLIIDDEAAVRLALRSRLSKLDCVILEAATPEEARDLIAKNRRDLSVVILDLRLVAAQEEEGRESGLELFKDVLGAEAACLQGRTLYFNPSVIVLTAYPNVQSCRAAFLSGAMDYLDKNDPRVWSNLLDRVSLALQSSRQQSLYAARAWVESHADEVLREFAGKSLALKGERVVACADSLADLKKLLPQEDPHPEDYLLVTIAKA